jgi:GlpG protein
MYALLIFGNMIEARQSTWQLASLVLVIAGLSNLAQYYMSGPMFCGMSGVVYGLLGYIWMRGKFDPASGLFLHRETVAVMLVWFVFCMTPLMDMVFNMKVANTVHAVGLLVGVAWGYLSSPRALRNRSR